MAEGASILGLVASPACKAIYKKYLQPEEMVHLYTHTAKLDTLPIYLI